MSASNELREKLSAAFLSALQEGQLPWRAVWRSSRPCNAVTDRPYRGVNTLNLSWIADQRGYTDPRWCTFHQATEKGWKIRKGEKAARVEYWTMYDRMTKRVIPWAEATALVQENPEREKDLQLRCYISCVFNAAQIEGIPPMPERPVTGIDEVLSQRDTLLNNMYLAYREKGDRAYYSRERDIVTLPPSASFEDVYGYMSTFLHECSHATGHSSRLNRPLNGRFGSPEYAREELRAEIASAFTAQSLGLKISDAALEEHLNLHKAYVQSWAAILSEKPEELFAAIKDANAIADYLIDIVEHPAISTERAKELRWCFENETNEPETQEWREELSAEEERLIEHWEDTFEQGIAEMVEDTTTQTETMKEKGGVLPSSLSTQSKPRFTEEQLLVARECSALEYARSCGYDLVRKGNSYQLREHDSMVFLLDGGWFWNSRQKHGRAIEFMMEYEGMTLPEAVLRLNGIDPKRMEARSTPEYRPKEQESEAKKALQLPERAESMKRAFSYLANTRGIDYDLLRRLANEGRIYQSDTTLPDGAVVSNAVFVGMDEQGKARSAALRGCGSSSTFRLEAAGSDKSYPFTVPGREGCKKLYVFESPIDAMSHATLCILGEQVAFDGDRISIGGSGRVEAILRTLHRDSSIEEICFCLDNDEAGRNIAARLKEKLLQSGISTQQITEEHVPCGKDWNEYLQTWRGVVARHEDYETTREMDEKDMAADVCGRIHLLDGDGAVAQTYSYRSKAHFRNAARLYHSRGTPCVIETLHQLEAEQRKRERLADGRKTREAEKAAPASGNDGGRTERTHWEAFEALDRWNRDGRPQGVSFTLGSTGAVLQGLGAIESDIYINGDKISKILTEHTEMTLEEIRKIPQILDDPVMVLKSRNVGRGDSQNTRLVIFGAFKAKNEQSILLILDLRPQENGFTLVDMQRVTSAYTKTGSGMQSLVEVAHAFFDNSDVLYLDEKRTASVLRPMGFYMPISILRNGYMGSITYSGNKVKITGTPFSEVIHEADCPSAERKAPTPIESLPRRRSFKALAAEAKEIAAARNAERTGKCQTQNLGLPSRDSS